jgi:hypothetical protein
MINIKDLNAEALKEILRSCGSLLGVVFNNCEFMGQFNTSGNEPHSMFLQ